MTLKGAIAVCLFAVAVTGEVAHPPTLGATKDRVGASGLRALFELG